jgi:hypothetical protein
VGEASLIGAADPDLLSDPWAWLDLPGAKILKKSRNVLAQVPAPDRPGDRLLLKIFPLQGVIGALQSGWRPSKARKAWTIGWSLVDRGFSTPTPRLALELHSGWRLLASALWVDWIPGRRQLRELLIPWRDRPRPEEESAACHQFLRALAPHLRRLHDAGVLHRDFSGGNVLVGDRPGDFLLVDVNRARIRATSLPWRVRMLDLERVHLHREDREVFFRAYCADEAERLRWQPLYLRRAAAHRGRG